MLKVLFYSNAGSLLSEKLATSLSINEAEIIYINTNSSADIVETFASREMHFFILHIKHEPPTETHWKNLINLVRNLRKRLIVITDYQSVAARIDEEMIYGLFPGDNLTTNLIKDLI